MGKYGVALNWSHWTLTRQRRVLGAAYHRVLLSLTSFGLSKMELAMNYIMRYILISGLWMLANWSAIATEIALKDFCLLYTSPSPRDS